MTNPSQAVCIEELIRLQAEQRGSTLAFLDADGRTLSYARLAGLLASVKVQFDQMGIGCQDRVAIVMPNGPELALTFLTCAACAASAPLNPAYGEAEFEFYLSDLGAKALILLEETDFSGANGGGTARHSGDQSCSEQERS